MKKVSKRTRKFQSSEAFATRIFTARKNGLTNILSFLARGSKVKSNPATVSILAQRSNLF